MWLVILAGPVFQSFADEFAFLIIEKCEQSIVAR